jgi:hypothetical protein
MIVSGGSNGEEGPKSTINPVPFEDVWKVTVLPSFTQNREFPLALGKLGVAVALFMPSLLMSTEQPDAGQVFAAVHRL